MRRPRWTVLLASALTALAALALAITSLGAPAPPVRLASSTGELRITDSASGAILSATHMLPGSSARGTTTVVNDGAVAASVVLSASGGADKPGPNGGRLGDVLVLTVDDVTTPASPQHIYTGSPGALADRALGTFTPGETRTYAFAATFPDGGQPPAPTTGDNAFQGSAYSVEFDWTATEVPAAAAEGTTTTDGQPESAVAGIFQSGGAAPTIIHRTCLSRRRFRIRLQAPHGDPLRSAKVTVNGRRVRVRPQGGRLVATVDMRRSTAKLVKVRVIARTRHGRRFTETRTYHPCVPKRLKGTIGSKRPKKR